jgi:O-antigen ligase
MNKFKEMKISKDHIYAIFIIVFVSIFVLVNYLFGFNLSLWFISMLVGAILAFAYPRAGLYSIIFLTFIFERFFTLVPIIFGRSDLKLYPIDIILGAILASIFFKLIFGNIKISWKKVDTAIMTFSILSVVYFFVSIFILNGSGTLAFSSAKNYAFYSLLYFVSFLLIDNKERIKDLAAVIITGGIGICWFVFYGIAMRNGLWSEFTPLSTEGIRTLAFTHGYYLSLIIIFTLIYIAYRKNKLANFLMILLPVWILGIVGSMMRHIWLAMLVTLVYIFFIFTKNQREQFKKYVTGYIVLAFSVFIVLTYLVTMNPNSGMHASYERTFGILSSRVTSIASTNSDDSIIWRTTAWKQAAERYISNPIFGIGFGQKITIELGNYRDFVEVRNIHNSFLVLLVQMGILGVFLIAYVIIKLAKNVFQKVKQQDEFMQIVSYCSIGILVFQTAAFMFQPYLEANMLGIFFWINLGLLRSIYDLNNKPLPV